MTTDALIKLLTRKAETAGSQKALAAQLGISTAYLCDILQRRTEPGPKVLAALGLIKTILYERVSE